jgi:multiple sugar transport system permease protein
MVWIGWIFAFLAILTLIQILFRGPNSVGNRAFSCLGMQSLVGAVGLLVGAWLPKMLPKAPEEPVVLPLVWLVMPYSAWLSAVCIAFILVRCVQAWFAIEGDERIDRLRAAGLWLIGLGACVYLYWKDPTNKIEVLRGGIPFSWTTTAAIVLGLIAAMAAMVAAGRAVKSRGFAKTVVAQLALIAGSLVFGLPFAFLVITSFKEDRDMSSQNGIVWVPRVQESILFKNPRNRLFETTYRGQRVAGVITEESPDGTVRLDIETPLSIRGTTYVGPRSSLVEVPRKSLVFRGNWDGVPFTGFEVERVADGGNRIQAMTPASLKGQERAFKPGELEPVRNIGLLWQNYPDALGYMPPETQGGLVYLKNTLILVVLSVVGTVLSSSIVAYAFSRMKFPGRDFLFGLLLATMMLPGAVTLLPQFLIFRTLGWIDSLYPLWVPTFFASAFNVFLLRQFFKGIPMELEDAAKIDGCSYIRAFWNIMLPQIKPALAVISIWTFMAAWNNFMGPLIYVNSPENMPLSYALQLFQGDRSGEPGLLMAFATMTILPVLALFFFAQKYFIEGVTLSGLGGR